LRYSLVENQVGVLGATSVVGASLLPLLQETHCQVTAFSRQAAHESLDKVSWQQLPFFSNQLFEKESKIPHWICAVPVWVLPQYFDLLETAGASRVVVLSSTSRFSKDESSDFEERVIAQRLAAAEQLVEAWAEEKGIQWIILRPTLIYGFGRDKNITEIARFISRFGFFPLYGNAAGLRQPVHVTDVADVCVAALRTVSTNQAYNISGGETLTYREMVERIFGALGRRPRFLSVPLNVFKLTLACLRLLPRYKYWCATVAERMNRDLVYEHSDASKNLGYKPRAFLLSKKDIQQPKL